MTTTFKSAKWIESGRDRTREAVRIRDKRTCQDCGKKWKEGQRRFDIHHLNGECGKKSRGYDRIADIKGLITFCHSCHMKNHVAKEKFGPKITGKKLKSVSILYKKGESAEYISLYLGVGLFRVKEILKSLSTP